MTEHIPEQQQPRKKELADMSVRELFMQLFDLANKVTDPEVRTALAATAAIGTAKNAMEVADARQEGLTKGAKDTAQAVLALSRELTPQSPPRNPSR